MVKRHFWIDRLEGAWKRRSVVWLSGVRRAGKTFLSQAILEAAGAIRVRSDVERKRLFGLAALQASEGRVAGGIYDADATARTYARLHDVARIALGSGWPLIVDVAFLRRAERAGFAALARTLAVPFTILDCGAELAVLRQRLVQRRVAGGQFKRRPQPLTGRHPLRL